MKILGASSKIKEHSKKILGNPRGYPAIPLQDSTQPLEAHCKPPICRKARHTYSGDLE